MFLKRNEIKYLCYCALYGEIQKPDKLTGLHFAEASMQSNCNKVYNSLREFPMMRLDYSFRKIRKIIEHNLLFASLSRIDSIKTEHEWMNAAIFLVH